jgi:hypothetical protein
MKYPTHFINPITIIAIFAALSEASATSVLPHLSEQERKIYIWFLIVFPCVLVVMFFLTLNFNPEALHGPPGHKNNDCNREKHQGKSANPAK